MCLQDFMSSEICTLVDFQKKFHGQKFSTPFYDILKAAKKGLFFVEKTLQRSFQKFSKLFFEFFFQKKCREKNLFLGVKKIVSTKLYVFKNGQFWFCPEKRITSRRPPTVQYSSKIFIIFEPRSQIT